MKQRIQVVRETLHHIETAIGQLTEDLIDLKIEGEVEVQKLADAIVELRRFVTETRRAELVDS